MRLGIGAKINVLKMAEINIPTKEMVIIRPVKMGKLNDKIVKLNLAPPKKIGSQPKMNNKSAPVAHDQYPSSKV